MNWLANLHNRLNAAIGAVGKETWDRNSGEPVETLKTLKVQNFRSRGTRKSREVTHTDIFFAACISYNFSVFLFLLSTTQVLQSEFDSV